ncbi:MAG: glycosyltransferase family 4 protein [Muribaculaceae bacterium]|nr:glycosyltransferase family 4 protein [Muribaculaceae bacterium]
MAFELQRRGHEVVVMTAIPDYPKGSFFEGYGFFKKRTETVNGVKVHRSFIIPRGKGGAIRLFFNYISYAIGTFIPAIRLGLGKKFDSIIVFQLSPVMVGIPAALIKKYQKVPILFWVQDLWPESLEAAGGIKSNLILKPFTKLTSWLYKNSDKILISSKGFKESITEKGDFKDKIVHYPNWIDKEICEGQEIDESSLCNLPEMPKGFVVLYAGNIGDAQDIPAIVDAAISLKLHHNIHFVFLGDGRKKDWLLNAINENHLEETVHYLGRFPLETMPYFFSKASVLFFSLKDSSIFRLTVPSRVQAFMAAGKPIVAMINGEGADVIRVADCGYSVPAGDSKALAELLLKLSKEDEKKLAEKGYNGKMFSQRHYDFSKSIDNLESLLNEITNKC